MPEELPPSNFSLLPSRRKAVDVLENKTVLLLTAFLLFVSLIQSANGAGFLTAKAFPAAGSVLAEGDFNLDGKLDVVAAGDQVLTVLLGNGDGTLQVGKRGPSISKQPTVVLVEDFNDDNKPDLAIASRCDGPNCAGPGSVSILLGRGDGSFQSPIKYSLNIPSTGMVLADFNGDGKPNLAISGSDTHNLGGVNVLIGNGNGTFQPPQFIQTLSASTSIGTADFNSDGKTDLITTIPGNTGLSLLLGNGDGTFQPPRRIPIFFRGYTLVVADFNHDTKSDLLVEGLGILLGNGDGTFETAKPVPGASRVTIGDFNGDGQLDLAILGWTRVGIMLGKQDLTFQPPIYFVANPGMASMAVGDLNRDGVPDLTVTGVSVLLGYGDGTFKAPRSYDGGQALDVGDFNNHGRLDLALGVTVLCGIGDGGFRVSQASGVPSGTQYFNPLAVGNMNGDKFLDRVIGNGFDNTVSVVLGTGTTCPPGSGARTSTSIPRSHSHYLATRDFNRDGKLDVLVANNTGNFVSLLFGNGDGTLQAPKNFGTGGSPTTVAVADFNGDGNQDFAVASAGFSPNKVGIVSVFLGLGGGRFAPRVDYDAFGDRGLIARDFNGDGKIDLAVTGNNAIHVLRGNGDGTFQASQQVAIGVNGGGLAVTDFNGDGKLDLGVAIANGAASILLGNGDGTFQSPITLSTGGNSSLGIVTGDFTGGHTSDLVVSDSGTNTAVVFLNTGGTLLKTVSSSNPAPFGQPLTFTTRVSGSVRGTGIPAGTITFQDGPTVLGTAALSAGEASLTVSGLSRGVHKIVSSYSGDADFYRNLSSPFMQVIQ